MFGKGIISEYSCYKGDKNQSFEAMNDNDDKTNSIISIYSMKSYRQKFLRNLLTRKKKKVHSERQTANGKVSLFN